MTHSDEASNANMGMLPGPAMAGHHIQHEAHFAEFLIDQKRVYCTPSEYKLLLFLLEQANSQVTYEQLILRLDKHPSTDPRVFKQAKNRVMHHISGIRNKIWAAGLDIVSVMNVGYILLNAPGEDEGKPRGQGSRKKVLKQEHGK